MHCLLIDYCLNPWPVLCLLTHPDIHLISSEVCTIFLGNTLCFLLLTPWSTETLCPSYFQFHHSFLFPSVSEETTLTLKDKRKQQTSTWKEQCQCCYELRESCLPFYPSVHHSWDPYQVIFTAQHFPLTPCILSSHLFQSPIIYFIRSSTLYYNFDL